MIEYHLDNDITIRLLQFDDVGELFALAVYSMLQREWSFS